ncbi:ornithine cyclodeaminase family protein [Streptomyces sp. PTM05]|uniref:Ornithine cyclodeaminase family protein n=1 Tax=Streptantibioticus parmotrematis TaxID=2873249 RepID=A0ABS7R096_9ACTN|nr:ornithine cyclodeaminase family protein [Streptantibioticus parmotrematis]MBY8888880.1 ornithine cyclodeaminase family protein [Streptantibioticus parmotrematis]
MEPFEPTTPSGGRIAAVPPEGTTLLLSDDEVREACDMPAVIDAVEAALGDAPGPALALPPRSNLEVGDTFFRVLPAILGRAGVLGLKMLHGSFERGVRYLLVLCDLGSGEVVAVLDAAHLTGVRTGATAGVATRHLARQDATAAGVIGAGFEAETNLTAVAAVRDLRTVKVYSPRQARREAFAARMSTRLGVEVVAVGSPEEAVAATDVIVVATNTGHGGPVALRGEWIEPGQHIVSIGSTTPAVRELDTGVLARADTVVLDVDAATVARESGDVIAWHALDAAAATAAPTLTAVLNKEAPGRRDDQDITVFKSIGAASQDLAAAVAVCGRARALGIGTRTDGLASLRTF